MQIQVNTDSHIQGRDELVRQVEAAAHGAFGHFRERITRLEVHLNDENSHKPGDNDKRCLFEARLGGLKPIAVTHRAATLEDAIDGAADKLRTALDRTLGKLGDHKGRTSYGGDQTI